MIYKIYDPNNESLIFTKWFELKDFLGLTKEDYKKIRYQGIHRVSTGDIVLSNREE